jgi:DNA polymerase ligase (LigD)-like protein
VPVEHHPLEYIDFKGIIPARMYGAGAVVVWDSGDYDILEKKKDKIAFILKGKNSRDDARASDRLPAITVANTNPSARPKVTHKL